MGLHGVWNARTQFQVALLLCSDGMLFAQQPLSTNATARPAAISSSLTLASSFEIKKGFRIELVTPESMISSPVAMAFDENGRLFVVEMRDYPNARERIPHLGRVRLLEDSDGDGVFDSATVYADNLPWPSAVACYDGGIFVAATPEILYFKDLNGNGVADQRKVVFTGFGPQGGPTNAEALVNSFCWGLDNRIHGGSAAIGGLLTAISAPSQGPLALGSHDFSFDPRELMILPETGSAQTGLTFNSQGHKFSCDLTHPLRTTLYDLHYFSRNPWVPRPPEELDVLVPGTRVFRFAGDGSRPLPPNGSPGSSGLFASSTTLATAMTRSRGSLIYRGSAFPSNYLNNVFIADPAAHVIHRAVLIQKGLEVAAQRPPDEATTEFLVGKDPSFHPVQIIAGPDGALYIADMVTGGENGRIFRVVPENFKQPKPPQLGSMRTYDLVTALAGADGWHRDTAARLLFQRRDATAIVLLTNMLNNSRIPHARLQALHTLDGMAALNEGALLRALQDPDERVREHAVALCERMITAGKVPEKIWTRLSSLTSDPAFRVRYQLAFTLGEIYRPERTRALAETLQRDLTNRWFQAAVLSSVSKGAPDLLALLASDSRWRRDPTGLALLGQLGNLLGVKGQSEEVAQSLDFIINARLEPLPLFVVLSGIGEGLHRVGSSLDMVDTQGRLQPIFDQSLDVALNDTLPNPVRVAALRLRGFSPYASSASGDIFQLLFGTGQSDAVQAATITTLGRYENPAVVTNLFLRWPELSAALRGQVITALLTRTERVPEILAALENGRISPADLSYIHINFLRAYSDLSISQRALRIFGPLTRHRPAIVAQFKEALRLRGTASNGRQIFLARCSSCHDSTGQNFTLGPDLAASSLKSKEKLLSDILEPNAEIAPDHVASVLVSRHRENVIGIVQDQNPTLVTLLQPDGTEVVWPRLNIDTLQPQPWSLMPEGLEQGLGPKEMADLIEYLTSLPLNRK